MQNTPNETSSILKEEIEPALSKLKDLRIPTPVPGKKTGHIYFLFKGEEVVYVGQTTIGLARVFMHRDKAGGSKDFDSVAMLECDLNELDEMESEWIIKLRPRYNKRFGPATVYYPRGHSIIKDYFLGCAFDHLVANYEIRTIQLKESKSRHYHLSDLHEAAQNAFSLGQLEILELSDGQPTKYFTPIPENRRTEIVAAVNRRVPLTTEKYPKLTEMDSNEVLFLQELYRLIILEICIDISDGLPWVTKTHSNWLINHFPTWSLSTLLETIEQLSEQHLIRVTYRDNEDAGCYSMDLDKLKDKE